MRATKLLKPLRVSWIDIILHAFGRYLHWRIAHIILEGFIKFLVDNIMKMNINYTQACNNIACKLWM